MSEEQPVLEVVSKIREIFRQGQEVLDEIEKRWLSLHPPEAKLNSSKLGALSWTQYASGSGAWIFADTKGAEELYAALKQRPEHGRIELEGMVYRLSHGETRDFIGRTRKGT